MANLNQFKKQFKDKAVVSNNIKVFTVSIGQKATQAKYYIKESMEIVDMFSRLHNIKKKSNHLKPNV